MTTPPINMDERAQYLTQFLDKIGTPLMASVLEASTKQESPPQEAEAQIQSDAQTIAGLLGKTVQTGIDMGMSMDFGALPEQGDSLRVALTALAGPLIAHHYVSAGQIPTDTDIKRITTALQAVLTFSENFSPSPANIERLKNISASGMPVDEHQVDIQYIQAFIPVVNAVAAFPFGQPEQKLLMDISNRLVQKAAQLREVFAGDLSQDDQKFTELALLRTLASIYATCHEAETTRIMAMNDDERMAQPQAQGGGLSLDKVWAAFDSRSAMVEALIQNIVPGANGSKASTSRGGLAPDAQTATPPSSEASPLAAPPAQEQPKAPHQTAPPPSAPPPVTEQPASTLPAGGNPMSMFAKKPAEKAETAPPSATPPPVTEQPANAPPPATPATEQPSAPPPASESAAQGGGPMSFFKKNDENKG